MPGLRCPGPTITAPYGNYSFLQDVQTPTGRDATWDRPVDLNFQQHLPAAAGEAVPFVPNTHKACRPVNYYADWMKGKANALLGPGYPISVGSPSHVNGGNDDDDDDLADMVDDYFERGSSSFLRRGNDSDTGPLNIAKLCSSLQTLTSSYGGIEGELLNAVWRLVLSIDVDTDLICNSDGTDCRGGCIKRLVVSQLLAAGYDAAVCKSKWEGSGRVLGGTVQMGEYEYIDVKVYCNNSEERLIVDVDFQDQFVLARATANHLTALKLLPTVFVGTTKRLEQILQLMSESVKVSLKQNSMPLPPWRTLDFMTSKWLSAHERSVDKSWTRSPRGSLSLSLKGRLPSMPEIRQCDVQLRRVKESLLTEVNGSTLNILGRARTTTNTTTRQQQRGKRSIL